MFGHSIHLPSGSSFSEKSDGCDNGGNDDMSVLAADFGGTRIKIGLIEGGRPDCMRIHDTPGGRTLESQLPELRRVLEEVASGADSSPEAMIWALPCIVAPDHRTVTRSFGKFADTPYLDLAGWAYRHFGLPLWLDNDARAAAVGEWRYGAGVGCSDMVMVTLGTGIGTAVISEGRPLYGKSGSAGNLGGHNIIHAGGRECLCGQTGCAEAHVGTWALAAIARESARFPESALAGSARIDYRTVFELARRGDALAATLKADALRDWTVVLTNLIHQFDPQRIVIGGGVMAGEDEILPLLQTSVRRTAAASRGVELHAAALGDSAALLGGAALWKVSSDFTQS